MKLDERVPIIKIEAKCKRGYIIINESDFDEKLHKLYVEKPVVKRTRKVVKK